MGNSVKTLTISVCVCSLFLLAACSSVYSVNPVGEKPAVLDTERWDGNWLGADGVISVTVKDAEQGAIHVAWVEDMELNAYDVYLLESGDWLFFNLREEEEDGDAPPGYFWGRIKNDGNSIILWEPEIKKFRALVREGVLPGEAKMSGKNNEHESDVVLDKLTAEHMEIIMSGEKGVLFDWDDPMFLIKLHD